MFVLYQVKSSMYLYASQSIRWARSAAVGSMNAMLLSLFHVHVSNQGSERVVS